MGNSLNESDLAMGNPNITDGFKKCGYPSARIIRILTKISQISRNFVGQVTQQIVVALSKETLQFKYALDPSIDAHGDIRIMPHMNGQSHFGPYLLC
jgi:hypothetical protein